MKKFYIESNHMVNEWSNIKGEGDNVNNYDVDSFVQANDVNEAIEKYIENVLCFSYSKEYMEIGLNSENEIQFSNIVNDENIEDNNGNYIVINCIYVYELCEVDLKCNM